MDLNTLLQWFYTMMGLVTVETLILVWAKRDVKLGLRKWWFKKTGKLPVQVRVIMPNKAVEYYVIPTKGKGQSIQVKPKRSLLDKFKKSKDEGMLFFLDPEAIRMGDDNVPEITYTAKSVMPIDEQQTKEQVQEHATRFVTRFNEEREKKAKEAGQEYVPVKPEELLKFTDPQRLNEFTDLTYLSAKRQALKESGEIEKFVKWSFYAAAASALMGITIWWTLRNDITPLLNQIWGAVQNIGTTVLKP